LTRSAGVATIRNGVISPWYVFITGIGGGVVNSLLVERSSLVVPSLRREGGILRVEFGFVSNIALGIAAAFLPYLFGIEKLTHHQQIGVSLLGAIGGASFIGNFVQADRAAYREAQADLFERTLLDTLRSAARRRASDGDD
jgi:hypothetical protein